MDNFQFVRVGMMGCGLTNQIGFIISGIMYAKLQRKQFVILDDFNCNFNTISPRPISEIIDLDYLNQFLTRFDIHVLDKHNISVEVLSVKYGSLGTVIDITNETKKRFLVNGKLLIHKGININDIKGDPVPGITKHLFIKYRVNDTITNAIWKENPSEDINLDVSTLRALVDFSWMAPYDTELYDAILQHIRFQPEFTTIAQNILMEFQLTPRVNILHLRDDEDAINFWGSINKMPIFEFKDKLTSKYISLIKKHFDPQDSIIVLTSNLGSPVLKFLYENGYQVNVSDKSHVQGRELNAILDLLLSNSCTNTFIGNINPENFHGSTFSYLILRQLSLTTTKVLIDLDEIDHNESIILPE